MTLELKSKYGFNVHVGVQEALNHRSMVKLTVGDEQVVLTEAEARMVAHFLTFMAELCDFENKTKEYEISENS